MMESKIRIVIVFTETGKVNVIKEYENSNIELVSHLY